MNSLVAEKYKINIEATAAMSALGDEVPALTADIDEIDTALTAFNALFEGADKLESIATELSKLNDNLKSFIQAANNTKITNVIDKNTSNIRVELTKLFSAVDTAVIPLQSGTSTTLLDGIEAAWDTLRDHIIDSTDDGVTDNIDQDTNNGELHGRSLKDLQADNNQAYNQILTKIFDMPLELPPSSAMAGVYARVDADRGVWKAPANVSLKYVVEPSVQITHEDQEALNVDTTAGKSVNAIRAFAGKGNLVWGARTLAGNDNEWRYVSVRRFFNMAEESIKKATEQFVFEPNDKNTWVRVKAMINNF